LIVVGFLVSRSDDIRKIVSQRDTIAYWAAARLLIQHHNPYDASSVLELEREQGYSGRMVLLLLTPPWSLFILLPLGLLNAFGGWLFWTLLSLGSLVVALRLCWKIFGKGAQLGPFYWVVGYTFAPVAACLITGQTAPIVTLLACSLDLDHYTEKTCGSRWICHCTICHNGVGPGIRSIRSARLSSDARDSFHWLGVHPHPKRRAAVNLLSPLILGPVHPDVIGLNLVYLVLVREQIKVGMVRARVGHYGCIGSHCAVCLADR
jgi:hypothetical protein